MADALIRRGINSSADKDYTRGLADCNQAIDVDPSRPEGYYGRGLIYCAKGEFDNAVNEFDEAVTRQVCQGT